MTLDYKRFRTAELARFAHNRNLNVEIRPRKKRRCYLRALIDADNDATFRFFDLPAEMRNSVYECLLTLRELKHGSKCYPEILATCKQVNREAREYFTVGNHSMIHMHLHPSRYDLSRCGWVTLNGCIVRYDFAASHTCDKKMLNFVLDSNHISIVITMLETLDMGNQALSLDIIDGQLIDHALYALYYLLRDAARTPSVDVKVKLASTAVAAEKIATLFSPLALYDAPKTFEAAGVDASVLQAVKASATAKVQHRHTADQLRRCRELQSATYQLECLRMRLGYGRLIWSTDGERLLNDIMLRDDCMTMEKERELSLAIDRYEVEINDSYFAQIEARIQELAEENRAMAKEWAKRMGKA
ncbi:hypothetical protein KC331_g4388 [Hortaea werneckii]|uniref:F-box domain-containing protein n=1 Tax=Hortaea werneckii TaxID=91943 RepID=A0A3M7AH81_HORWE|nr:hypothetical protein KC331_g4388 [Hortaea werneckii]KAI7713481.1 hypothetical protein KC353_g7518 [Hortaea werneckii]RMY26916.1 hypothetical protein D0865_16156 [Hortaea werneckii]